jgi:purine-nucleoside phosphorylase
MEGTMPTPHNEAEKGQIAKTVLMPGDPLRAKFIAETFLTDVKLFNNVRGMLGYTGKYNGKEVSVMGHGMGIPSIGIYSYELYDYYDVENIIRVGSAGGLIEDLNLFDVVLATSAYSPSTYAKELAGYTEDVLSGDEGLLKQLEENAAKLDIPVRKGCVCSSDAFYRPFDDEIKARYKEHDVIAVEMEYFALCANARKLGKKAACVLSISDNMITQKETTSEEREKGFTNMMKLALSLA